VIDASRPSRQTAAAFALTVSLFALWGLGHWFYEALVPQFARAFDLAGYKLALTQSLYSIVYFVGAIPAALFARRLGGKIAILAGLGAIAVGAFTLYPAAEMQLYAYFLVAIMVMAAGWVLLEIAANPLAASLGPDVTFVWRLNFAQSFYPVGALAGMAVGHWVLNANLTMPDGKHTVAITHPYIVLGAGVLLIAFLFEEMRFPTLPGDRVKGGVKAAFRRLFVSRRILFAVAAQAFSVMALVGSWTPQIRGAFLDTLPDLPPGLSGNSMAMVIAALAAGRFAGTALMGKIEPATLLAIFAAGGIAASLVGAAGDGWFAAAALLTSSFFLSITWPTILGLAIEGTGSLMKPATALICMGGAAGGVAHQFIETAWPFASAHTAMLLPAVAYGGVLAFALSARR
jgi:FHS family L-fucose permease-like MFS transporter